LGVNMDYDYNKVSGERKLNNVTSQTWNMT